MHPALKSSMAVLSPVVLSLVLLLALTACGGGGGGGDGSTVPAPRADRFTWTGNTRLNVTASDGLLANDPPGTNISTASNVTGHGGAVTVNLATGAFVYDPPVGLQNADDTFSYTTSGGAVTATITLEERIWYVRNTDAGADQGTQSSPFLTLAQAEAAADENDILFVFAGDQTDTGQDTGITLKNGQRLLGEGVGLRVNGVPIVDPVPESLISNAALAAVGDSPVVTLASNNEVAGFILQPAFNEGILAMGGGGYSLHDNIIRNFDLDNGSEGIRLLHVTGENLVTRNTISGSPGTAIKVANNEDRTGDIVAGTPGSAAVTISLNTIANVARSGIAASFDGSGSELTLNILTNTITNAGDVGADKGIRIDSLGGAGVTTLLSRNSISGSGGEAIGLLADATAQLHAFSANGNLTGSGAVFDFHASTASPGAALCLELVNNANAAGNSSFQIDNGAGGDLRFFEDLNDTLAERIEPVVPITPGECGIPLDGAALFETNCGHCHRGNGLGRGSVGPNVTNTTADKINFQIATNFSMSDINLTQQEIAAITATLSATP
jgi:hypothetical protein